MSALPFAISPDASLVVLGDGPELLVYDGGGAPRWHRFVGEIVVGVAASVSWIAVALGDNTLVFLRATDGQELRRIELEKSPLGLTMAPDETLLVIVVDGVVIATFQGECRELSARAVTCASFGPNRGSIGYGTADGTFTALDPATGMSWGSSKLVGAIGGIAWSNQGVWVVSTPSGVHIVSGDGQTVAGSLPKAEAGLGTLAVSTDGVIVAAVEGGQSVAIYETTSNTLAGHVRFRRDVHSLAFGGHGLLGIGLDDGDAHAIDLFTGASWRTEPHPGRGRNNWAADNQLDMGRLRGATAMAKTKGADIASFVEHTYGPPPEEQTGRWWIGILIGAGFMGFFMCTGLGSGALIAGWYMY